MNYFLDKFELMRESRKKGHQSMVRQLTQEGVGNDMAAEQSKAAKPAKKAAAKVEAPAEKPVAKKTASKPAAKKAAPKKKTTTKKS